MLVKTMYSDVYDGNTQTTSVVNFEMPDRIRGVGQAGHIASSGTWNSVSTTFQGRLSENHGFHDCGTAVVTPTVTSVSTEDIPLFPQMRLSITDTGLNGTNVGETVTMRIYIGN